MSWIFSPSAIFLPSPRQNAAISAICSSPCVCLCWYFSRSFTGYRRICTTKCYIWKTATDPKLSNTLEVAKIQQFRGALNPLILHLPYANLHSQFFSLTDLISCLSCSFSLSFSFFFFFFKEGLREKISLLLPPTGFDTAAHCLSTSSLIYTVIYLGEYLILP